MKVSPRPAATPRLYRSQGVAVPSVTTVLGVIEKRHLESWRARVGRQEADRVKSTALALGNRVHVLAHKLAWDLDVSVEGEMELYALALKSFLKAHVAEPLFTERSFVSEAERVGGTPDLYCRMNDGALAVVDYKTSAQLSREHGLQTALYALLLREHGYDVQKRICVRIKKDKPGEWYARSYTSHRADVAAGRACVELYWWMHRNKLLKAMEVA